MCSRPGRRGRQWQRLTTPAGAAGPRPAHPTHRWWPSRAAPVPPQCPRCSSSCRRPPESDGAAMVASVVGMAVDRGGPDSRVVIGSSPGAIAPVSQQDEPYTPRHARRRDAHRHPGRPLRRWAGRRARGPRPGRHGPPGAGHHDRPRSHRRHRRRRHLARSPRRRPRPRPLHHRGDAMVPGPKGSHHTRPGDKGSCASSASIPPPTPTTCGPSTAPCSAPASTATPGPRTSPSTS